MILDENKKEVVETPVEDDIQDLKLNFNTKKKFRIDNDSSRILEIDTSDLSVLSRLQEYYPKLIELEKEASKLTEKGEDDEATVLKLGKGLAKIDKQMREYIDIIFDANVSSTCAPSGSMYDPINGQLRYEHIISIITGLYEQNLSAETKKLKARVAKYTDKYTKN